MPQRAKEGRRPEDASEAPEAESAFGKARVTAVLESDSDGRPGNALELLRPAIVPAHARLDADDETDTLDSASTTNKGAQAIRLDDRTCLVHVLA